MTDWWEALEAARSRLFTMRGELRGVASGHAPPLGPELAELFADWCDWIAEVLRKV